MYRRILAPLDGSEAAEQALPYVHSLAKGLQASVHLFAVVDAGATELVLSDQKLLGELRQRAQTYLEKVARSLMDDPRVVVTTGVGEGAAAGQILLEAEKDPATLIAMSTHGRSGITRWVVGSVAEKVLVATSNPLLLVRARDSKSLRPDVRIGTIIAALDGSALSEGVLLHVGPLAKALNLKTTLLRVTPSAAQYYRAYDWSGQAYGWTPDLTKWAQEVDADAREYLGRVAEKLRKEHYPAVEERLLNGDAASAIVETAKGIPDSLVAMTTHGRSGVGRWALGSVADRVVRDSESPVLLIRAKG